MTEKDDIEFLPDDEPEIEVAGAEDDALHVEAEQTDEAGPEESDDAGEADEDDAEPADEHEEDLEEILHRHYGIVDNAEAAGSPDDEPHELGPDEFVCRTCFTRRSTSQLADPARGTCVDCTAR
jgi:hypothetical protein